MPAYGAPAVGSPVAPSSQGPKRGVIIAIAAVVAAVIIVPIIAVITVWLVFAGSPGSNESAPPPVPTSSPIAEPDEPADPTTTEAPDLPGGDSVEAQLEALFDKYLAARNDGSLWQQIPDTEFNRTAVVAFLYLITDLKGAAAFGADTSDYMDRAAELERKLLAEEPLGTDISIKGSERTFTYDGETGAGGYTDN